MVATDWWLEPTDARDGDTLTWPWVVGMDDAVAIDLVDQLDEAEPITNPVGQLWRLKATSEPADTDVSDEALVGLPAADGTIASQRVSGLEAGRVYRLIILHGAAGNRRAATVVIQVNAHGAEDV